MTIAMTIWIRVSGLLVIAIASYWLRTRKIPVGWDGEAPSFHLRGRAAVIAASVAFAFGLLLVVGVLDGCFSS